MKENGKRLISVVLSACLMLGVIGFAPIGSSVAAAATASSTAEANYGQFQVKLTADPVTDAAPDGFGTAASAGRIWTDKSVTAENDGSFNVKLSALAQEYMTSTTTDTSVGSSGGNPNAPAADVTFILDMSGSMSSNQDIANGTSTNYYRVEAMAKAANAAIHTVMDANPNNKVGVYWFTGSYNAVHVGTLLDMGHYTINSSSTSQDYLQYSGNTGTTTFTITPNSSMQKDGQSFTPAAGKKASGGTPTQDGIRYGISNSINFINNLGTKASNAPQRMPYVFLLSDGAATVGLGTKSWNQLPSNPALPSSYTNLPSSATGNSSTGSADYAAAVILTGMYMKNLLNDAYSTYNGSPTKTQFYTVGMASSTAINGPNGSSSVYAWAGLDPKTLYEKRTDNAYLKGTADTTGPAVATCASLNASDPGICTSSSTSLTSDFVYSDHYIFANTYDLVLEAFNGMANDVQASTTILPLLDIPKSSDLGGSETADMASAIVIADEIGDGFDVDLSTLKIGDTVAAEDTSTPISGGKAYKFAGYGSKAVIKTVNGVSTLTWYIDADDMQPHIYRFTNRTSPVEGQYTAPTNGAFALNYKVKPAFEVSPDNVVDTAYYLNAGNTIDGAKTAAYFAPPEDSPYYKTLTTTTVPKATAETDRIGAAYVTEESLADGKVTMKLGNNGRLDLEMGIVKTGPASVQNGGKINYQVKLYNYTDTDKTDLSVTSDGSTQTGITVPAHGSEELTFSKTAPGTSQTLTSDKAEVSGSGIDLVSNTVTTDVTDVITHTVTTYVIGNGSNSATGGGVYNDGASVTLTATPAQGYVFVGWYDNNAGTGTALSTSDSYTFTATANGDYYAKFNSVPVAVDDTYHVMKGETLNVSAEEGILSNDTDGDGKTLTATDVSALSDLSKGNLNVSPDGSFTFEAQASGSTSFKYNAYNGISKSNQANVMLNITTPSVVGSVYDRDNDNVPVFGATVVLSDRDSDEIMATTTTDEDGNYAFTDVVPGYYKLKVTDHGFSPVHKEIEVSTATGDENGVVTVDFELVGFEVALSANPSSILGNGMDTSDFTAMVVDKDNVPQAGIAVVFEMPNTTYGHFANGTNTITAVTNEVGSATVTFTSEAIGGETQTVPLTATVNDSERDLYADDTILITFNPGAIVGIVTDQAGNPVVGATVEVSRDFDDDGIVDFHAVVVTGGDGRYTIGIPKGNESYDVFITKPVNIDGEDTPVTFTQNVTVSGSGSGNTLEANKTASGIVMIRTPQGASSALDGTTGGGYTVVLTDGNGTRSGSINGNGVFNIDNVLPGSYTADVIYNIPLPGGGTAPIVIGHADILINANGQISISEVLIDPYGTITDSVTHDPVPGVKVTLHYSDGTTVTLPSLPGFPPADNANPQTSDTAGEYAFMVFPNTDYYITATKTGYKDFDSRTVDATHPLIHVDTTIVQYNFGLTPLSGGGGGSSTTTEPTEPVIEPDQSVDLATAILTDKMKAGEGDTVAFTVIYADKTAPKADGVYVKVSVPAGMSVVDANGGAVTGNEIKWSLGKLAGGARGQLTFKLKVNDMSEGEDVAAVTAKVGSDNNLVLINPQDDTSLIKLLLYSNRFEHKDERYIKGYPDGTVKPAKLITRAEIAAIFARTLHLQGEVQHVKMFSDVDTGYWGTEYIEAVVSKGIFKGYENNTFRPDQPITRAELATAIARYLGVAKETKMNDILRISSLTDISGNWAEQSIEEIFRFGIVSGYEDATFHPNSSITREEAIKMINGMLYRGPLTGVEPSYPDNHPDKWSFGQVEEATRTHISKINADGSETMTEFIPEPLW